MLKRIHCLVILMVLVLSSGCVTIYNGTPAPGQGVDAASDPGQDGWAIIKNMDDWIQRNLW